MRTAGGVSGTTITDKNRAGRSSLTRSSRLADSTATHSRSTRDPDSIRTRLPAIVVTCTGSISVSIGRAV